MKYYDNSSLQDFKDCQERYRLRNILGLKKREEGYESIDKYWGKAIHKGLEAIYTKSRNLELAKEAFRESLGDLPFAEDKVKTKENGEKLIEAYVKHYEKEDANWEILEVEQGHTFALGGFPFTVKRDMVVRLQGNIFAVEHKTTKKALNWDYWARYEPNSQISAQVYSTILKYGQCSGVIVNALKVGYTDKATLYATSEDAQKSGYSNIEQKYSKYYKQDMFYCSGFYCEFQRQVFNRNLEQVKDWQSQTTSWLKRLDSYANLPKVDLLSTSWEKNEGQCYFCSYKEICNTLGDEGVVESLYEKVNPWLYLEEKSNEIYSSGVGETRE